ncbi:hypothetical protein [Clostridium sp.]|uniref:hypothetical protein n=1 Tax=Clostridium sp. TaxID=1506 RepID=UPI00263726CB|nr:hypothetical protein [Clostridium sp.]
MSKKMKPEFFLIRMFPTVSIKGEILERILDAFESNEYFMPAIWSNNEKIKIDYNRNEIIEKVSSNQMEFSEIYLRKDKSAKYTCRFSTVLSSRSFFSMKIDKKVPEEYWPIIFSFSDKIAEIVRPSFGVTHIFWSSPIELQSKYEKSFVWMDSCAQPAPADFIQSGPAGVGMRTYFSGKVLELFGEKLLKNMSSNVYQLKWGGICVDLLDKPWEADIYLVLDSFINAMNYLEQAHVLAIPSFDEQFRGVSFSPNIAWKNKNK